MRTHGGGRYPKSSGTQVACWNHCQWAYLAVGSLLSTERKILHWKVLRSPAACVSDKRLRLSAGTPQTPPPQPLARTSVLQEAAELYSETAKVETQTSWVGILAPWLNHSVEKVV